VNIDRVWIGNRTHCTLIQTITTLYIWISQRLVFLVMVFTALLSNIFLHRTFLCSHYHVLAGWQPSPTNNLLYSLKADSSQVKVKVMLWQTVSQPVFPGVKTLLWSKTRFLFPSCNFGFFDFGHSLWREDGSVVYNCCWPSPAQTAQKPPLSTISLLLCCLSPWQPAGTWCLQGCSLATSLSAGFTILTFSRDTIIM
jgi:hypothetical protein